MNSTAKRFMFWSLMAIMLIGSQAMAEGTKKVLFIDSYHEGYAWSDGITKGVTNTLGDKAQLKIFRMDTKRNPSEEFKKEAAEAARKVIEEWRPDVVIAADDNASKYIIQPFYLGKDLPFVFCGLNWDCSLYGFPAKNICGMEEVALIEPLLQKMKAFAKGGKIAYLSVDNETARKEAEYIKKNFGITFTPEVYVTRFAQWQEKFKLIQKSADMVIIDNNAGITEWSDEDARKFVLAESAIPSGCIYDFMAPYCLIGYTKVAEEQGEWAAAAALRILSGESPEKIGVTRNKKGTLYVNLPMAQKLGVKIPLDMLKNAQVIKE